MTKTRCAIYTRKSSEEVLDQDFNSLDARREACAAYIASHRHEGWVTCVHPLAKADSCCRLQRSIVVPTGLRFARARSPAVSITSSLRSFSSVMVKVTETRSAPTLASGISCISDMSTFCPDSSIAKVEFVIAELDSGGQL